MSVAVSFRGLILADIKYNTLNQGISLEIFNGFLADFTGVFRYYDLKMSGIDSVNRVFLAVNSY